MSRFFCLLFTLCVLARADADAAYQSPEHMVATSQAIALVQIEGVETVAVKGQHWTYRQRASARVERTLKGALPVELALYGAENFICAQCRFAPGRALVFLKRDGNLWTGNNWHLGARPIENDQIQWFDQNSFALKSQPLASVLKQLQTMLEAQAKAPKFTLSFQGGEIPTWSVHERHAAKSRVFERAALENWLRTLPVGSEIYFLGSCDAPQPDAANPARLASVCYGAGLQWEVGVAG